MQTQRISSHFTSFHSADNSQETSSPASDKPFLNSCLRSPPFFSFSSPSFFPFFSNILSSQKQQSNLGVLGGDLAGFPNGRRPGDDVVDIVLSVAMGVLCHTPFSNHFGCTTANAPVGDVPFSDGADGDAKDTPSVFPYLAAPIPGARL